MHHYQSLIFAKRSMRSAGFTLIELSIVLVIIGLIVGGILVGRELIHTAQLRGVLTEIEKFETARMAFKLKYNCFPGDCASAINFGLGNSGNGNDLIEAYCYYSTSDEPYLYWQHLAAAGLISGNFTGTLVQAEKPIPLPGLMYLRRATLKGLMIC